MSCVCLASATICIRGWGLGVGTTATNHIFVKHTCTIQDMLRDNDSLSLPLLTTISPPITAVIIELLLHLWGDAIGTNISVPEMGDRSMTVTV